MAQRVPLIDQRIAALMEQRNAADTTLRTAEGELGGLRKDKKFWLWVMQDPTGGRFQEALQRFQDAEFEGEPPVAVPTPTQSTEDQQGELVYRASFQPVVRRMAESWSLDGNAPTAEMEQHLETELERTFRVLVNQEGRFLSQQRLREMFEFDLPNALLDGGYVPIGAGAGNGTPPVTPATNENTRLRAELANAKSQLQKGKVATAPDGGGSGTSTPGSQAAEADLSNVKSFEDVKKLLNDPNESFGM